MTNTYISYIIPIYKDSISTKLTPKEIIDYLSSVCETNFDLHRFNNIFDDNNWKEYELETINQDTFRLREITSTYTVRSQFIKTTIQGEISIIDFKTVIFLSASTTVYLKSLLTINLLASILFLTEYVNTGRDFYFYLFLTTLLLHLFSLFLFRQNSKSIINFIQTQLEK